MKKLLAICLAIAVVILPIGCSQEKKELTLNDLFTKSQEMTYYETASTINLNVDANNIPDSDANVEMVLNYLKDFKIETTTKMKRNTNSTEVRGFVNLKPSIAGMTYSFDIWSDMNLNGDAPYMSFKAKIPEIFTAGFGINEYLVLDTTKLGDSGIEGLSEMKEQIAKSSKLSEEIVPYVSKFLSKFEPPFDFFVKGEDRKVDDENVSVYTISLDNEKLYELLKYTLTEYIVDDEIINDTKALLNKIAELTNEAVSEEEIDDAFKQIKDGSADITNVLEKIKGMELLGEKGINIEFLVNKKGFVVGEKVDVDIAINFEKVMNMISQIPGEEISDDIILEAKDAYMNITASINTTYSNINADMDVEIPETDEKNSTDIIDLITMMSGLGEMM